MRSAPSNRSTSVCAGWPWFSCSARAETPNSTANWFQERVTEAVESTSTPSRSNSTASKGRSKSGLARVDRRPVAEGAQRPSEHCAGVSAASSGMCGTAGGRAGPSGRWASRVAPRAARLPAKSSGSPSMWTTWSSVGATATTSSVHSRSAGQLGGERCDHHRSARRGHDVVRDRAERGVARSPDELAVRRRQPVRGQHRSDEAVEQWVRHGVEVDAAVGATRWPTRVRAWTCRCPPRLRRRSCRRVPLDRRVSCSGRIAHVRHRCHDTGVITEDEEDRRMAGRLVAGMDLGSTGMKLLVLDEDGVELVVEEVPTPWRAGPGGTADLPAERLVAAVAAAARATAANGSRRSSDAPVVALAIAGMGETGMVVDAGGQAGRPRVRVVRPARRRRGGRLPRRGPRRVRRAHRPPARPAGLRRQARPPAGPRTGVGRPPLAEPAGVRR